MTPRRTNLPSINNSFFSGCDMEPVLENMNLFYLAQNYSSVTRLNEFVCRCQMYNINES